MNIFNTEPKHQSATDAVLWRLKNKGSITQLQCISLYGSWKLSRIIGDLSRKGLKIETEMVEVETRFGFTTRVAKYYLIK